jgi:APA family basic amino acid/polyamine antiporter
VLWVPTALLLGGARVGGAFLNTATLLKIALIVAVALAAFLTTPAQPIAFFPAPGDAALIASAPFAVSLVYVMYAYTGWNSSVYIVGEIRDPEKSLPRSLALATLGVMLLYVALNAAFLRSTPLAEMAGKVEIGLIAGTHVFGAGGARLMALLIGAGLVSAIMAMMWTGPRVAATMGEDWRALQWLASRTAHGTPARAILVQAAIATVLLLTGSFEKVLTYVQLALVSCSFATVLGVIVLRHTQPDLPRPYRTWGYPLTPLVFLAISAWMMIHVVRAAPVESFAGLATMALGLLVYYWSPRAEAGKETPNSKLQTPNKFQ